MGWVRGGCVVGAWWVRGGCVVGSGTTPPPGLSACVECREDAERKMQALEDALHAADVSDEEYSSAGESGEEEEEEEEAAKGKGGEKPPGHGGGGGGAGVAGQAAGRGRGGKAPRLQEAWVERVVAEVRCGALSPTTLCPAVSCIE